MSDRKPFKIKNVHRSIRKDIFSGSLEELRNMAAEKFEKPGLLPTIHLDSDGTEVDDEEYYRTLEPNAELIAVFPGEQWIDRPLHVYVINTQETSAAADVQNIEPNDSSKNDEQKLITPSVLNDPKEVAAESIKSITDNEKGVESVQKELLVAKADIPSKDIIKTSPTKSEKNAKNQELQELPNQTDVQAELAISAA